MKLPRKHQTWQSPAKELVKITSVDRRRSLVFGRNLATGGACCFEEMYFLNHYTHFKQR